MIQNIGSKLKILLIATHFVTFCAFYARFCACKDGLVFIVQMLVNCYFCFFLKKAGTGRFRSLGMILTEQSKMLFQPIKECITEIYCASAAIFLSKLAELPKESLTTDKEHA